MLWEESHVKGFRRFLLGENPPKWCRRVNAGQLINICSLLLSENLCNLFYTTVSYRILFLSTVKVNWAETECLKSPFFCFLRLIAVPYVAPKHFHMAMMSNLMLLENNTLLGPSGWDTIRGKVCKPPVRLYSLRWNSPEEVKQFQRPW